MEFLDRDDDKIRKVGKRTNFTIYYRLYYIISIMKYGTLLQDKIRES